MYEKIKGWISNNRFLVGMGVGAVLFLACHLFGRAGVHDNGKRAGDVGTKLQQAVSNQQSISNGIADCHHPRQGFCERSGPRLTSITTLQVSVTE